jgi:hypothetical protein
MGAGIEFIRLGLYLGPLYAAFRCWCGDPGAAEKFNYILFVDLLLSF